MKHIKKFLAMLMAASIIVVSTCAGTMPAQGNSEVDVSKEQVNEVSALAAADNRIPLSVLDVAQWDAPNNNNNTILHGTEGAVATFDADVATCWKQGGNNIVIDLGGWYDVSEISLVQMTSGPGNTFAVYGSGNSADLQTLALDDQSRASVFCLYSDKAGANGIMTNTKRDLNINSTTATSAAALKNIRYLKVWRGNQLFDIKVFGSLVTEATDKRIPLTESMLIGHSAGKNGTYMVDGAIPGKYWNESPAAGVQPYILLDLGAYYKLSDFKVFHLKQTVSYDLYAGREVDTLAKCGTVDVSAFGAYPCKVSLDIPVRYVKLVKTTDPWMQTMELCLYGKAQGALTYHDVTFDSRNGAANTTVKVESGKTIGESFPANPVNGNYGFMGWYYKDSSGQEQQLTSTTVISEKIDAYAKWQIVHTVTFMNGANIHATVKNVADGVAIGSTLIPPSPSWADESFIFGGWFSNVGGIEVPFNADTVVTADVTVNAKWNALIPSAEYFDISRCVYINNNELLPVAPATTAKSIACLFDGILFNQNTGLYNIDAEGNKDVVIDLGGYYNLSNIMLACTSKGGVATLRVAENYSEAIKGGGQVVISYTSGLPEWYSAPSTTAYSNIRYLILNKNWNGACELKLYGARTDRAIKNYTVSFATNGGTAVAPIQVEEHHYLTLPASPTKEGLHFIDWYTDNNFLNIFDQTQAISSDLTLYARYSPKVPINAELDNIVITGGISGTGKNIACLFDGDYVKGYGIKDSDTLVVDLKRECNLTRMLITIYNYGTGGKPFVVRLSQNADFTNAATVNIFRTGSAQDAEKKSYDIFMCNVDASNVRYVEIKAPVADRGVMGLAELEFYGDVVGSSGIRPVTFDLNGGTGTPPPTKEYLQGASVDLPKTVDASKYRHSFIGWALTPSATQALASYEMGANPVTFYAVWQEEPKYTLTLDLGTGYTQEYTDFTGTIVSLPSQMQRSGYLFDAWYDAEGKPFSGNKYTISACNITLTARWNYI
ncbi:MAG: InlB B-repeat-containing protein [Oscillospiraceae bacterium]